MAKQIKAFYKKRDVPHRLLQVLQKRCIENYLPQEALDAWAALPDQAKVRPRVAMMTRLDAEQRDYFPMKKGFSKGISEDQKELFASPRWNQEDRSRFLREEKGFGPTIVHLFREHRDAITPEALRQRCGPLAEDGETTELDQLVARICAEL